MGECMEGGLCLRPPELPFSAVLLDPPAELEARRADEGGHVLLRWLPPPGAPMASLIRYEVNISAGGAAASAQKVRLAPTAHPQLSQRSSPSKSRPDGHHGLAPPGPPPTPDIPLPWGPRQLHAHPQDPFLQASPAHLNPVPNPSSLSGPAPSMLWAPVYRAPVLIGPEPSWSPASYSHCSSGAVLPSSDWSAPPACVGSRGQVEILDGRTECVLSNLRRGTRYTFTVRARMAEPSFDGFWSAWSEPASLLTASGEAPGRGVGGLGLSLGQTHCPDLFLALQTWTRSS